MVNIRIYDGRDGRYIHADDLVAVLREGDAVADPVTAIVLPRMILLVETLRDTITEAAAERGR